MVHNEVMGDYRFLKRQRKWSSADDDVRGRIQRTFEHAYFR